MSSNFDIKFKPELGNHLISTSDFTVGEVIFTEEPTLIGPNHLSPDVCLNCLKCAANSEEICTKCSWCLCRDCRSLNNPLEWHDPVECEILASNDTKNIYDSILPLRLLREALSQTRKWDKLKNLVDHYQSLIRKEDFKRMVDKILPFIQSCYPSADSDLILQCIGKVCINAIGFEFGAKGNSKSQSRRGRGLYQFAVLASHNCVNSAAHSIHPESLRLTMRARRPITAGDEITISYVPLVVGQPLRACHILDEWNFVCQCSRCLGLTGPDYLSALICQSCNEGTIFPPNNNQSKHFWTCDKCEYKMSPERVKDIVTQAESELRLIGKQSQSKGCLQNLTIFLDMYKSTFYKMHFLMVIATRNLWQIQRPTNETPRNELMERIDQCEATINVIKKIGGGHSEWLGFLLSEMAINLVRLDKTNHAVAMAYLREVKKCQNINTPIE